MRGLDDTVLAALVADLQQAALPGAVGEAVCGRLAEAFGFPRVLLLGAPLDQGADQGTEVLSSVGLQRPINVKVVVPEGSLVARAQACQSVLTVPRIEVETDPWLAGVWQTGPALVVPLTPAVYATGALVVDPGRGRRRRRYVRSLERIAAYTTLALRNAWLLQQATHWAATDALTGIPNRRSFDEVLGRELSRASRAGEPVSLLMIDLDHFKQLNDRFGHQAGDLVLRRVGDLLVRLTRASDVAARYGGEEFAVVLPSCGPADAVELAERFRRAIERDDWPRPLTVSVGAATAPTDGLTAADLVGAADAALYAAKAGGRNQVRAASGRSEACLTDF